MTQVQMVRRRTVHNPTKRVLYIIGRVLTYVLLTAGALVMLYPFIWMVMISLGSLEDLFSMPPRYVPERIHWENYPRALTEIPFFTYLRNTLFITATSMVGQILSCAMTAYSFARLRWRARDFIFVLVLATMMMPPQVTLIPTYVIWRELNALDTYVPLIVPGYLGTAYLTFLARQYFSTIPFELEDAAKVDGCGYFSTFFKVIMPLSLPLLATLAMFSFIGHWNDFFGPLIYLQSPEKYTLQLALMSYRGTYSTDVPMMMALATMILMPVLIFFLFGQQYFIQSVVLTGLKG